MLVPRIGWQTDLTVEWQEWAGHVVYAVVEKERGVLFGELEG